MYIDGKITDTTLEFALRDRYGNLSEQNMAGTLTHDQDTSTAVFFSLGRLSVPRSGGYWRIDAPDISKNSVTYIDNDNTDTTVGVSTTENTRQLFGISFFHLYVPDGVQKYNFLPDYNARYTVLAGDSYLREGSQILYETAS